MTGLTEMTTAASARHSIGKRRDRSEKTPSRHQSQGRCPGRTRRTRPYFPHQGTTAPARIIRPIALEYARSGHDECPNLIASPLPTGRRGTASLADVNGKIGPIVARLWGRASMSNGPLRFNRSGRAPSGARPELYEVPGPSLRPRLVTYSAACERKSCPCIWSGAPA